MKAQEPGGMENCHARTSQENADHNAGQVYNRVIKQKDRLVPILIIVW